MVPTFSSDTPTPYQIQAVINHLHPADTQQQSKTAHHDPNHTETEPNAELAAESDTTSRPGSETDPDPDPQIDHLTIIGLRMPYDLPLTPYGPDDEVWSARASYAEPDAFGRTWNIH